MINLHTKFKVSTFNVHPLRRYERQRKNVEIGVVWGRGSPKVTGNDVTIRRSAYGFLFIGGGGAGGLGS